MVICYWRGGPLDWDFKYHTAPTAPLIRIDLFQLEYDFVIDHAHLTVTKNFRHDATWQKYKNKPNKLPWLRLAVICYWISSIDSLLLIACSQRLFLGTLPADTTNNGSKSSPKPCQQTSMLHFIIDNKPPSCQVVYWAKRNCYHSTSETYHVVWHAEVRCWQRDQQSLSVQAHEIFTIVVRVFKTKHQNIRVVSVT